MRTIFWLPLIELPPYVLVCGEDREALRVGLLLGVASPDRLAVRAVLILLEIKCIGAVQSHEVLIVTQSDVHEFLV